MTTTSDLGAPIDVALEEIHLDPNNPRIALEPAPGYADAKALFNADLQNELISKVYEVYNAPPLETSIIEQGWTPVDPIIVWRHPSKQGYVVIEGNTRISILHRVRIRLERERAKLARIGKGGYPKTEINTQHKLVEKIEELVDATATLRVHPVVATSVEELEETLPRVLGVRHISPAKQWSPYARNLYILSLYEVAFERKHGPATALRLEEDVLEIVADQLPLKKDEIRKGIQAASAFGHFKREFEERVEGAGNKFVVGDQYFFDNILANKYAREEFEFEPYDLHLSEKGEEALFQWAFAKPRQGGGDDDEAINENVFQKAEDIRIWQRIARYDAKTSVTNFAKRLNVDNPEDAIAVWRLEREMHDHREKNTPVKTLGDLLKALKDLKADTLKDQGTMLKPTLQQLMVQIQSYLDMIASAQNEDD